MQLKLVSDDLFFELQHGPTAGLVRDSAHPEPITLAIGDGANVPLAVSKWLRDQRPTWCAKSVMKPKFCFWPGIDYRNAVLLRNSVSKQTMMKNLSFDLTVIGDQLATQPSDVFFCQ